MRKIFTILCVMAFSNTFGVDPDCSKGNPDDDDFIEALHQLKEKVDLSDDDLETLGGLIDQFDSTLTRPSHEEDPNFEERLKAMNVFVNEVAAAEPGDVIPMPYSLEVFLVKSQEETMHEMLNHPKHCIDTILGNIIKKQLNGEEEIPEELMPPVILDSSGMLGIDQLSEKQLQKMFFSEMSIDYSKFSLEDLGRLQIAAYSEMFIFLNKAEQCAKRTYEYNLRTAIAIAFSDGIKDILSKPSPRLQVMKNLAKGIMYLAAQSYTDLQDMYHNLEMAILWAEKSDNYGTAAAKRMGHK